MGAGLIFFVEETQDVKNLAIFTKFITPSNTFSRSEEYFNNNGEVGKHSFRV